MSVKLRNRAIKRATIQKDRTTARVEKGLCCNPIVRVVNESVRGCVLMEKKYQNFNYLPYIIAETVNDVATEARDMENDVDYDSLDTRLSKLEKV